MTTASSTHGEHELDPDLAAHAAAAEEVRAYLVAIRGGAPFLSGADARLLVDWLGQGVPVPVILGCIDRTAEKRRRRRARSRLTLARCKSEVRKTWGSPGSRPSGEEEQAAPSAAPSQLARALAGLAESLAAEPPEDPGLAVHHAELLTALRALSGRADLELEPAATEAIALCRRFHEAAWDAASDRDAVLAEARAELAPLEASLDARTFAALVDESARARLRGRIPGVSADRVWDTLTAAVTARGSA